MPATITLKPVRREIRSDWPTFDPDYFWFCDEAGRWHGPFNSKAEMDARIAGTPSADLSPADELRRLGATVEEADVAYKVWVRTEEFSLKNALTWVRQIGIAAASHYI